MPLGKSRLVAIAVALLCACNGGRDKLIADLQSTRPDERGTDSATGPLTIFTSATA